jgi:phosphatidylserine/phosphatidylglycerophosphate/cardiolipin synthase-like enzyme
MKYIDDQHHLAALSFVVAGAKHSIWLMAYNVSGPKPKPDPQFLALWNSLLIAPSRSIDCRLILPAASDAHHEDTADTRSANALTRAGWITRRVRPGRLQHSKNWIVDGTQGILTSANLSETALTSNIENLIVLQGSIECAPLRQNFMRHWMSAVPV